MNAAGITVYSKRRNARLAECASGILMIALGITVITISGLGTAPVSSLSYVLSFIFPPTIGMFSIMINVLMMAVQVLLLRKEIPKTLPLQLPASILMGFGIDLFMFLLKWLDPGVYGLQFLVLVTGCLILGTGVALEVDADVVMLPGEGMAKAVSIAGNLQFGTAKIISDSSVTATAILVSLLRFHTLLGLREGTVIAAVSVGMIARQIGRMMS